MKYAPSFHINEDMLPDEEESYHGGLDYKRKTVKNNDNSWKNLLKSFSKMYGLVGTIGVAALGLRALADDRWMEDPAVYGGLIATLGTYAISSALAVGYLIARGKEQAPQVAHKRVT